MKQKMIPPSTDSFAYDSNLALLRRLYSQHVHPYRKRLGLAVVCMVIAGASSAANAWLMQPVLDHIFIAHDRLMLMLIPIAVLVVAVVNAGAGFGQTLLMRFIGQRVVADVQIALFEHLMKCDLGLFHDQASGRLISRFTNDIQMLRHASSSALTALAKEMITLIFLLGVMIYQNLILSLIAFSAFPLAVLPILKLGKRTRKLSDNTQHQLGEFTAQLDEIFSGVRSVKAYTREQFEVKRARDFIEHLFKLYYKSARAQASASPMLEVLSGFAIAAVIWYGGWQVLEGRTTAGAFFSFITAFIMAYRPLKSIANLNTNVQEGFAAASRLFQMLDTKPIIFDAPNAAPLAITQGHIAYEHVHFTYGADTAGVSDINLTIPPGKTVALVGLSGGGKSTLMNLLLRFYDVNAGRILIDGQDIRSVTLDSLRGAMALVPQETILFDDSVRANVAYGKLDATEEEIIQACKSAAADEFIRALPQGYDTPIGSHGVKLSGGQKQRISIARAMLKNAPILLLDEATSSLDQESERAVQQALTALKQGRTTLMIAHRLSTIQHADLIYVIEQGRVIESGNHASLMANHGRYAQLYASHHTTAAA